MRKWLLYAFACIAVNGFAQEPSNTKFGKINADELGKKYYDIDTGASAIALFDYGVTKIKGNLKGWFSLEYKRHARVHILNKNGYKYTTVEIPLYTVGENEEQLDEVRASTFNLENGKVVETKLDKNSIFKDRINKNKIVRKFTFSNVKEGSIIEFEYQVTSDFLFNLQPWDFQGEIPRLWSEYRLSLPQFLNYVLISQGNRAFDVHDSKDKSDNFLVSQDQEAMMGGSTHTERINISCGVTDFRWAMKNVPAMKEEAYTSTPENYVAKLDFQLAGYREPLNEMKIMTTWPELTDRLINRDDFGKPVKDAMLWLDNYVQPVIAGATTEIEKTRKIYNYIRDQFTCTTYDQRYTEQSLRNVLKNRNGGVAEINLLLTAMLRSAGLDADPVILSTRGNGFVYTKYPIIGRFNYVIARVKADGKEILLDASQPLLGFGKLNYDCYNGQARVVNAEASLLNLDADQLAENETISINLVNDKNEGWLGSVIDRQGYFASIATRQAVKQKGKENFFKEMGQGFGNDVRIENPGIDSLSRYDEPVTLHYDLKLGKEQPDIIYFDPILIEKYRHNPFKSQARQYPVEMPYKIDEVYILTLIVPDGYIAEEIPKPVKFKLDEPGNVSFEYMISQSGNIINLRTRLQVNKTIFQPSEYDGLREFFNQVLAKQNAKIVFKKKP